MLEQAPEGLLRIEDILPFFPPFVTIDAFRDHICHSLEDYNASIDALKHDMNEFTASAERIRQDIRSLEDRSMTVLGSQRCDLCFRPVLSRSFYLFPCSHAFHTDCLIEHMKRYLTEEQRSRVLTLQRMLASSTAEGGGGGEKAGERNALENELDDIVASECILCGEHMIREVSEPFLSSSSSSSSSRKNHDDGRGVGSDLDWEL